MFTLIQDMRGGWRSLMRQPLFTIAAVLTLTLGIGACAVIFSVVYALLLKPLPYADPARLMMLHSVNRTQGGQPTGVAPATLTDLQAALPPGIAALSNSTYNFLNLTHVPTPTQITVGLVEANYFQVLGVHAQLGRVFLPEDGVAASQPAVVLGNKIWRAQFHGDPAIIGQRIILDDTPRTVVGVMPPEFKEPQNVAELWLTMPKDGPAMQTHGNHDLNVLGRLSSDEKGDLRAVTAALDAVSANLARAYPAEEGGWSLVALPLHEELVSDLRKALWLLLGAVGCVLLVTCVNVANLQLVRANARRRELGIRLALGATRGRIARQWFAESLWLAAAGGLFGALAAAWGVDGVVALLPAGYSPRQEEIGLNAPVLIFVAAIAGLTGVLFGLLPAWFAARQQPAGFLAAGGGHGASEGPTGGRTRGALVVTEIALAFVLLAGAGLMARSFLGLLHVAPGIRTERVLTLGMSLSDTRYKDAPQRAEFYRRALAAVRAVPGVANVGMASTEPFNWWLSYGFTKPGQSLAEASAAGQTAIYDSVNPDFFAALDLPIKQGRAFNERDTAAAPLVAVVNEQFAQRFLSGGNPLGQKLTLTGTRTPLTVEVIGIAADVRRQGLDKDAPAQMYVCYLQRPTTFATLFVRADGGLSAEGLTKSVQSAVWSIDADQPITNASTLQKALSNSVGSPRLYLALFALFAGLTLALAALGIYGTVAYNVGQRTREIGIRLALGASSGDVMRLVLGQGARLVGAGLFFGLLASLGLGRLLASVLYGVKTGDSATLGAVAITLGAAALLACWLPARRAARINPIVALRQD